MVKTIIIGIIFVLGGFSFIAAGFYFLSDKYLNSLTEGINDSIKIKSRQMIGKVSGYFSIMVGALTLSSALVIALIPELKYVVALFYIIVLFLAFLVLMGFFKANNK